MTSVANMKLYTFELLLAVLLFTAIPVSSKVEVEESHEKTCFRWRGDFRNCMCGKMRRDIEEHCHDDKTYYQPSVYQDLRYCPFRCENGGTFDQNTNRCECLNGFFGDCCNTESRYGICGEVLMKPEGVIQSIGFPDYPYPPNQRCVWKIITDPERRIALSVKDDAFDIEQGSDYRSCSHDKLEIFDSENRDGVRIGSFCGKGMRKLETVYSTNNHLYIEFVSDPETSDLVQTKRRFELHYTTFLKGKECGPRTLYNLETGIITSPNYPLNYKEQDKCEYEIQALPDHDIQVTILEMNMPARADCSIGDKITLSKKGNNTEKAEEMLTMFCGTEPHPSFIVKNPSSVILKFTSDRRLGGTFKLRYNQIPSAASTIEVTLT